MPLKACLIGAGHMGRIHGQKLAAMKGVELVSVVDCDARQADETARTCGTAACDFREALARGLQAAVIASPTDTHYDIAKELITRGVHVFIEKPIAAERREAEELIALARAHNVVLQVGHLERFSPPFRKASRLIRTPFLIEAYRTSAFTGRSTDIDVIFDLMIHDIDLVLSLAKEPVTRITAQGSPVMTTKIDVAHAHIEFAGGCAASLTASRVSQTKERSFSVATEEGYFWLNLGLGHLFSTVRNGNGNIKRQTYRALRPDPVMDELTAFVTAVKTGRAPVVTGEDGLRAILLAGSIKNQIEQYLEGTTVQAV
jgi:predicted dehydrogenase